MHMDIIQLFIDGAKEAYKEVEDHSYLFPLSIESAYRIATSIEERMKEKEAEIERLKKLTAGNNKIPLKW